MGSPSREQVWRAIADAPDATGNGTVLGYLGEPGVDWATDAVMALLGEEPAPTGRFRVGNSLGITVYKGPASEDVMGMMLTAEYAAQVVNALNRAEAPQPGVVHDVVRRLLDGWELDVPCLGPEVWCWFRGDDDPEPLTSAEQAVLNEVKERK